MKVLKGNFSHLFEINLAMIFASTSGALGRYIQLSPPLTIASRALLAFIILWGYCRIRRIPLSINNAHRLPIVMSGLLMGAHFITYFYSLQLSSVAIGMLSLFTYPIITAFLEPVLLKTPFEKVHLFLGVLVLTGIYFLVPNLNLANSNTIAVGLGLVSALLYAIRNIILKKQISTYNGSSLMVWQMAIIAIVLSPLFLTDEVSQLPRDLPWILTLALVTTAIGHTLFLMCFRHFSITSISILSSIQPIYGILLGALFLNEIPTIRTVFGGALILSAVVIESYRTRKPL